jgi:hypothetical protein
MKQMKNAKEIAAMTIAGQKRIMAERHDRTMDYINLTMMKAIEKAASEGQTGVKFKVTSEIDRDLIMQVFTANDFKASYKGYDVSIDWWNSLFALENKS